MPASVGSSNGYRQGNLKLYLPTIRLAEFDSGQSTESGEMSWSLRLRNLSRCLNFQIAASIIKNDGGKILPADYPATPGTMQLIPVTNFPDSPKGYLREVFQDPALVGTDNANHPLAQNLPFGWNDAAETDEIQIDIVVDLAQYAATNIDGFLCVQAMVEYNGSWWDVAAIEWAVSRVSFSPGTKNVLLVGTAGGG